MCDPEIRTQLNRTILAEHREDPDTLVVEELVICGGKSRIDVAVVNGEFHGYEIKSDHDTLARLARQQGFYASVFDRVSLILADRHIAAALHRIPPWWGIYSAVPGPEFGFCETRPAQLNDSVCARSLAQLLWRDEALKLLCEFGAERGFKTKPKRYLWTRIAEVVPLDTLRARVRHELKLRRNWRLDPSSARSGG